MKKDYEPYKRMVRFLFSAVLIGLEVMVYGHVWLKYYNVILLVPHFLMAYCLIMLCVPSGSVFVYFICMFFFCTISRFLLFVCFFFFKQKTAYEM